MCGRPNNGILSHLSAGSVSADPLDLAYYFIQSPSQTTASPPIKKHYRTYCFAICLRSVHTPMTTIRLLSLHRSFSTLLPPMVLMWKCVKICLLHMCCLSFSAPFSKTDLPKKSGFFTLDNGFFLRGGDSQCGPDVFPKTKTKTIKS